ncbi:MAG: 6-carboxytetrahydropterin synthase [Cytophagaceae bacterium]|nr:6-carboxytetrahydropterin synthase [Cytophagaceae bacterium]
MAQHIWLRRKMQNIHGHSYVLHVTVTSSVNKQGYLPAPGLILILKI